MVEFSESVRDIEGLTSFQLGKVPEWLADCLNETLVGHPENSSGTDLVAFHLNREWLGDWGTATINGNEVFMSEYLAIDAWALFEPAQLAETLYYGLNVVEDSRSCNGVTAVFSEERVLIPRRNTATA